MSSVTASMSSEAEETLAVIVNATATASVNATATASSMMGGVKPTDPRWLWNHRGIEGEKKRGDGDQQDENWGRSHSALACQGESLASS
ncbi:hypothetical protein BSP239C_02868 [Brevibacterium sp. 239c]|nr:hypothetical protein BSP239C_02868 [Brevibacterium sp. 239c]